MRQLSESAQAAKAIRKILKKEFPHLKFTVTSSSNGGTSVNVGYLNGVPTKEVQKHIGQFQKGHFDGMTDCYEYSNTNDEIPQVKFLFVNRELSEHAENAVFTLARTYFNDLADVVDLDTYYPQLRGCARHYLHRYTSNIDFSKPITLDNLRESY